MNKSLKNIDSVSLNSTPQTKKADPRQVLNSAGGYVFQVDDVERLKRFLILGTEGGTYYTDEQSLSIDNAKVVFRMANTDHKTLVDTIVEVSLAGSAPKQDSTLFAFAIAASIGEASEKAYALSKLNAVARTGTHLFKFVEYVENFRGWGRGLRTAVSNWYLDKGLVAYRLTSRPVMCLPTQITHIPS